jgi:uncharacterized protein YcsI (UPF0317 family)
VDYLGRPLHGQQQQQQQLNVRPFIPAGRASPDVLLRGQMGAVVAHLEAHLRRDWPDTFLKVCAANAGVCPCIEHA